MHSLKDSVIIITGASSGIGKATALQAARKGAKLSLAARDRVALNEVVEACQILGVEAIGVYTDVSQETDCIHLIEKTMEKYGKIDVLINNAGISMRAIFEKTDLSVIKKIMDVNFWGTVYCTKYALPHLLKSKGSLVGVSSIGGYKGLPGRTGYSASKFAVQGFLETLRIENLKKDLHVLIACPGFTASNIRNRALSADGHMQGETPRDESKMMTADQVAVHLIHAIEKRKNSLVLTTEGKLIVLLNKFVPNFLNRMIYNNMAKEPDAPFG